MANLILLVLGSLLAGLRTQAAMKAEIIALRHQLIVLQRSRKTKGLILRRADRWLGFGSHDVGQTGVPP
jgi:hypothetical protein